MRDGGDVASGRPERRLSVGQRNVVGQVALVPAAGRCRSDEWIGYEQTWLGEVSAVR